MRDDPGLIESWSRLVRRRWVTGLATGAVVLATAIAVLWLSRPVHRSEAALRLGEPPPPSGVSPTGGILSFLQLGGDAFANDLELLSSRSVAEAVVERVALTAELIAPAGWYRDSLLADLHTTRETERQKFTVRWSDARVLVLGGSSGDSLVTSVEPGRTAVFGGVSATFVPYRPGMPSEVSIRTVPFARAVRQTRSALQTSRPRREANIVALSFDHQDPGVADAVVDAAIIEFIGLRTALHARESGQTVDSLRVVARNTAVELRQAEESLEQLQRDTRLIAPDAQSEALVERQTIALTQIERARAELDGVDEMLRRLDETGDPARSWTALLSYPAFLENQTLGELLTGLTTLHAEREQLLSRRTAENRDVQTIDRQIEYYDASLRELAREYRAGLVERIASLQPMVDQFDDILMSLPASTAELVRRQRDVRLLTEIVVLTEQRLRQEELRDALTYSNVQVVDPPALRDRPIWPRRRLGLLVGLILAAGFAMLGMTVRDRTDHRLRRVAQVREISDTPVLAVVVRQDTGDAGLSAGDAASLLRRAGVMRNGGRALTLVPLDGRHRSAVLRVAGETAGDPAGVDNETAITTTGPLLAFRDAERVADANAPAALIVEAGRTTIGELRRAVRLIDEAGGTVAGVVLVCAGEAEARSAWT